MRYRRLPITVCAVAAVVVLVATACGRSGFQYIESDDSKVFAKIPAEWEIVSEGLIDFTLVGEDGQFSVLPGDDTRAWRALFDAEPDASSVRFDRPLGAIEVQPVDRRLRSALRIESLIGFDPNDPGDDVRVLRSTEVEKDDLVGVRLTYETRLSGIDTLVDRLVLTDDRFTAVYEVRLFCDATCFAEHSSVFDEILDTFTVEVN